MTSLMSCARRRIEDFDNIIWLENPSKYKYVREATYICCNKNFKPIKKETGLRLIGYGIQKKLGGRLLEGVFWYLKAYDLGMPKQKEVYDKEDRLVIIDGVVVDRIIPVEAVTFYQEKLINIDELFIIK